jgi:hypothetical protein
MTASSPIAAEVLAVLGKSSIRVVLLPGDGQVDAGITCEVPVDLVPATLRLPGTKVWVDVDGSGNIVSTRPRMETAG